MEESTLEASNGIKTDEEILSPTSAFTFVARGGAVVVSLGSGALGFEPCFSLNNPTDTYAYTQVDFSSFTKQVGDWPIGLQAIDII